MLYDERKYINKMKEEKIWKIDEYDNEFYMVIFAPPPPPPRNVLPFSVGWWVIVCSCLESNLYGPSFSHIRRFMLIVVDTNCS